MIIRHQDETIASEGLCLEPLSVEQPTAMVEVLADASLYAYTGGEVPSLEQLQRRYEIQAVGHSDDSLQEWFNWILELQDSETPIGFVQATVESSGSELATSIAWVISPTYQAQGMASEATKAMCNWLRLRGIDNFVAYIHPEHLASMGVALKQGLHPTPVKEDGEVRWES